MKHILLIAAAALCGSYQSYCQDQITLLAEQAALCEGYKRLNFEQLFGITEAKTVVELLNRTQQSDVGELVTNALPLEKKEWTIMVYLAGDNDLRNFLLRNLQQMISAGSTDRINIVVHLDIKLANRKKASYWLLVNQNEIVRLNLDPATQVMDSGNPNTLQTFGAWAISNFPAEQYCLILSDHGTGIIDPEKGKITNISNLFTYNPFTNKLELDRSIGFLDFVMHANYLRGICWDDTTGNYLTNQDLDVVLGNLSTILPSKKFDIIGFDACLMSMIEIAHIVKKHAHYMVASEDIELGMGWFFDALLRPFQAHSYTPEAFAKHIVNTYETMYKPITDDFTLSALKLESVAAIEQNLDAIASLLAKALRGQYKQSVRAAIKASKSAPRCTHFDEPTYLDLYDFYRNLEESLPYFQFNNTAEGATIISELKQQLALGRSLINRTVVANTAGPNLSRAKGISIYFPEYAINSSYRKTQFARGNKWFEFLELYTF